MNPILRFLLAARSMSKQGMKKEQILDFAKREFGEVPKLLKKQIDDIFKKPATGGKKPGEVVPIKKKEGIETLNLPESSDVDMLRKNIEQLFGDLPRIELFARDKTEGWDVWGNEV